MELPVYYLELTEQDGLNAVSLVENPAIKENFQTFNQQQKYKFEVIDSEQRIIQGPAMLAEVPIYRRDAEGREYYAKFSAATIRETVKRWAKQGKYNSLNIEHSAPIGGVYLIESLIVDAARGISAPEKFSDAPEGSWFLTYYVEDETLWQAAKEGEFKGFSVEGFWTPKSEEEKLLAELMAVIAQVKN